MESFDIKSIMRKKHLFTLVIVGTLIAVATWFLPFSHPSTTEVIDAKLHKTTRQVLQKINTVVQSNSDVRQHDFSFLIPELQQRQQELLQLMQTNPQRALVSAISYSEYHRLPEAIKPYFEQPITKVAALDVLVVEADFHKKHTSRARIEQQLIIDDQSYRVKLYGDRETITSKKNILVQGVILQQWAAVYETALVAIDDSDHSVLRQNIDAINTAGRDFLTGEVITNNAVKAVGGGRLFYFANSDNLQEANRQLAILDKILHPHISSFDIIVQKSINSDGSADVLAQLVLNAQLAKSWSLSDKSIFFIRVRFSSNDASQQEVSQSDLQNYLDGDFQQWFSQMSYGSIAIESGVSTDTHVMANNFSSSAIHAAAISAIESDEPSFDADNYDIIGVIFPEVGNNFWKDVAGLATLGGTKLWIQNFCGVNLLLECDTNVENVYTASIIPHELGHNLGLYHASYYDNNVIASTTGQLEEYGNIYDIMGDGYLPESGVSVYNKQRLEWITDDQIEYVNSTDSGRYRLNRFDDISATDTLALRVQRNLASNDYLWLGYQRNYGDESYFDYGLSVNWQRPGVNTTSYLQDMTPGSKSYSGYVPDDLIDSPLTLGDTYYDSSSDLYITPLTIGGSSPNFWIDVQVNYGVFNENASPSVGSITVPSDMEVGKLAIISVTASDSDGDTLAFYWELDDNTAKRNSSTVAHIWQSNGTKTISVTVSDMKGGSVEVSKQIFINDPLLSWRSSSVLNSGSKTNKYFIGADAGQDLIMAVGSEVQSSSTGMSFSYDSTIDINQFFTNVVEHGDYWVGVGLDYDPNVINDDDFHGSIFRSDDDGDTWDNVYYSAATFSLKDVASNGASVVIVVGDDGLVLRSSSDGKANSWSQITSGISGFDFVSVAYGGGYFVLISNNVVYSSADGGLSWTIQYNNSQAFLSEVIYANGAFYISSDIVFDESIDSDTSIRARDGDSILGSMAYGNGHFVAIHQNANNDTLFTSSDGDTWQSHSNILDNCNNQILFYKNRFYVIGQNNNLAVKYCVFRSDEISTGFNNDGIDSDGDTLPDLWEVDNGLNYLVADADADADGDGSTNAAEYKSNTDPQDSESSSLQLQSVAIEGSSTLFVGSGATMSFNYAVINGDTATSGLGIRVHYDSNNLIFTKLSSIFQVGKSTETSLVLNDTSNLDADSSTDKYFEVAWSAENWPNSAGTVKLFDAQIEATQHFEDNETTVIKLTHSQKDSDYEFMADDFLVTADQSLLASTWDIDYNQQQNPLEDGIIFERTILGLPLSGITTDIVGDNAIFSDSAVLSNRAQYIVDEIGDIDGDGTVTSDVDGALLMRYLFGFDVLITDDITLSKTSSRSSEALLRAYLEKY